MNKPLPITRDTFVIADTHFGHKNVTEFEPSRQVATVDGGYENQEEMLIDKWNSVVGPDDHIIVLGDYAWKGIKEYTRRLNGKIELIVGNHDRRGSHAYMDAGFQYVYHTIIDSTSGSYSWSLGNDNPYLSAAVVKVGSQRILFSHYPIDFYEDYYTKQRTKDLTETIKELTDTVSTLGITINVHGHTHSKIVPDTDTLRYLNVSCENLDFTPIRVGDLLEAAGC